MAHHQMRLHPEPFKRIFSGEKTIEARLNDEKRQALAIGDTIDFISRENGEKVTVEIVDIEKAQRFSDLFTMLNKNATAEPNVEELINEVRPYYTEEEEVKIGVIGIRFHLI